MRRSDERAAERHRAWELRHPEERFCECGTRLSRYNIGKVCGPCRRRDR